MENPIKMDDLGVPLFLETPIFCEILTQGGHPPDIHGVSQNRYKWRLINWVTGVIILLGAHLHPFTSIYIHLQLLLLMAEILHQFIGSLSHYL